MSSQSANLGDLSHHNPNATNKPLPDNISQAKRLINCIIMIRSLIASLLLASTAHGFGAINPAFKVYQGDVHPAPVGVVEDDYDAPVDRLKAAGHLVEKATSVLDHEIVLDDDCYLGKDGSLDECADFDPPAAMRSDLRDQQARKYAGLVP